jgi:hypothetical protein
MILYSKTFDQDMLAKMRQHDPVVVFYCAFSELIDGSPFTSCSYFSAKSVNHPNHEIYHIKALLVKIVADKKHIIDL